MMDNIRNDLNFTNDTDWSAVQPLVQKVLDARRDVGNPGMRALFQRRGPAILPKVTEKAAKPRASKASTKIGTYSLIVVRSLHAPGANVVLS